MGENTKMLLMMSPSTGIGLDYAGVGRKPLTTDQAFDDTASKHLFKHKTKRLRVPEPPVTVLRKVE